MRTTKNIRLLLLAIGLLSLVTACGSAGEAMQQINSSVTTNCVTPDWQQSMAPKTDSMVQACIAEFTRRGFEESCAERVCMPRKMLVAEDLLFPSDWPHHVPSPAAITAKQALEDGQLPGGVIYANSHNVVVLYRKGQSVYKFVYRLGSQGLEFVTNYQVTGGDPWVKAVTRAVRGDGMRKISVAVLRKLLGQ